MISCVNVILFFIFACNNYIEAQTTCPKFGYIKNIEFLTLSNGLFDVATECGQFSSQDQSAEEQCHLKSEIVLDGTSTADFGDSSKQCKCNEYLSAVILSTVLNDAGEKVNVMQMQCCFSNNKELWPPSCFFTGMEHLSASSNKTSLRAAQKEGDNNAIQSIMINGHNINAKVCSYKIGKKPYKKSSGQGGIASCFSSVDWQTAKNETNDGACNDEKASMYSDGTENLTRDEANGIMYYSSKIKRVKRESLAAEGPPVSSSKRFVVVKRHKKIIRRHRKRDAQLCLPNHRLKSLKQITVTHRNATSNVNSTKRIFYAKCSPTKTQPCFCSWMSACPSSGSEVNYVAGIRTGNEKVNPIIELLCCQTESLTIGQCQSQQFQMSNQTSVLDIGDENSIVQNIAFDQQDRLEAKVCSVQPRQGSCRKEPCYSWQPKPYKDGSLISANGFWSVFGGANSDSSSKTETKTETSNNTSNEQTDEKGAFYDFNSGALIAKEESSNGADQSDTISNSQLLSSGLSNNGQSSINSHSVSSSSSNIFVQVRRHIIHRRKHRRRKQPNGQFNETDTNWAWGDNINGTEWNQNKFGQWNSHNEQGSSSNSVSNVINSAGFGTSLNSQQTESDKTSTNDAEEESGSSSGDEETSADGPLSMESFPDFTGGLGVNRVINRPMYSPFINPDLYQQQYQWPFPVAETPYSFVHKLFDEDGKFKGPSSILGGDIFGGQLGSLGTVVSKLADGKNVSTEEIMQGVNDAQQAGVQAIAAAAAADQANKASGSSSKTSGGASSKSSGTETKTATKTGTKTETKTATKTETKTATKSETKTSSGGDNSKTVSKTENNGNSNSQSKTSGSGSSGNTDSQTKGSSNTQSNTQSKSESKSSQSSSNVQSKSESNSASKTSSNTETKTSSNAQNGGSNGQTGGSSKTGSSNSQNSNSNTQSGSSKGQSGNGIEHHEQHTEGSSKSQSGMNSQGASKNQNQGNSKSESEHHVEHNNGNENSQSKQNGGNSKADSENHESHSQSSGSSKTNVESKSSGGSQSKSNSQTENNNGNSKSDSHNGGGHSHDKSFSRGRHEGNHNGQQKGGKSHERGNNGDGGEVKRSGGHSNENGQSRNQQNNGNGKRNSGENQRGGQNTDQQNSQSGSNNHHNANSHENGKEQQTGQQRNRGGNSHEKRNNNGGGGHSKEWGEQQNRGRGNSHEKRNNNGGDQHSQERVKQQNQHQQVQQQQQQQQQQQAQVQQQQQQQQAQQQQQPQAQQPPKQHQQQAQQQQQPQAQQQLQAQQPLPQQHQQQPQSQQQNNQNDNAWSNFNANQAPKPSSDDFNWN